MEYGKREYWEKRYQHQEGTTFDWLQNYEQLRPRILKILQIDNTDETLTEAERVAKV